MAGDTWHKLDWERKLKDSNREMMVCFMFESIDLMLPIERKPFSSLGTHIMAMVKPIF